MDKLVSIIIPNFNYGKYVADCIISCLYQTYKPIQVIIYDDCSTDNSVEVIKKYICNVNPIALILGSENRGVAHARNEAILKSSGEYIAVCDADDMLTPNSIKSRVDFLERYPKVGMVWGHAKKINVDRGNAEWSYAKCMEKFDKLETYSRWMNNGTMMWRREVFNKFGLYYEGLRSKEDKEFTTRVGIHKDSPFPHMVVARKIDDFIMIYRRHPGSKHKQRMADSTWAKETDAIFDKRIRHLAVEGITKENTRFPA